ncbi:MAG: cytochrome c maturation protein CcmE [Eggerthellaceae bacterium]|nr:cytochrome c maturation protein CcmE [Eggerthellaceae bacterium]
MENMQAKMKRRLIVATGVIVIVLVVALALLAGTSSAKALSIEDAASGDYNNQKVQVSGSVVSNSYETNDNILTFAIYDADSDDGTQLLVRYYGEAAATFGNNIEAKCTGRIGDDGVLESSELLTKCPSKYESATEALSVSKLLGYGESMSGTIVKVAGNVKEGTLVPSGSGDRFAIVDADDPDFELSVEFDDALSDEITDGTYVVLTGAMNNEGKFAASEVAIGD